MSYKVLGQSNPSASTDTDLYTVPSGNSSVISTLTICNLDNADAVVSCAVRPAGATIANQHYFIRNATITGNETYAFTIGVTMAATDVLTVKSTTANVSFNAFGSEITTA